MKKPYILISNDDGIHAEGIKYLYNALKPFADCVIVAPIIEKTGAGLSITHKYIRTDLSKTSKLL